MYKEKQQDHSAIFYYTNRTLWYIYIVITGSILTAIILVDFFFDSIYNIGLCAYPTLWSIDTIHFIMLHLYFFLHLKDIAIAIIHKEAPYTWLKQHKFWNVLHRVQAYCMCVASYLVEGSVTHWNFVYLTLKFWNLLELLNTNSMQDFNSI